MIAPVPDAVMVHHFHNEQFLVELLPDYAYCAGTRLQEPTEGTGEQLTQFMLVMPPNSFHIAV